MRRIFPPEVGTGECDNPEHLTPADLARLYAYPGADRPWVRANMVTSADGAATMVSSRFMR